MAGGFRRKVAGCRCFAIEFIQAVPQPSGQACSSGPAGREDAALRPGAAAGCRSLRDRVCRRTFPPKPAAAGYPDRNTRAAACGARASSATNCGPPLAEAAARRSLRDRICKQTDLSAATSGCGPLTSKGSIPPRAATAAQSSPSSPHTEPPAPHLKTNDHD